MDAAVMSVLGQGRGGQDFENLMRALMSPSNDERGQAEAIFYECKKHPDALVGSLIHTLQHCQAVEVRAMSAILLRKVITKEDVSLWPQLSPPNQTAVKAQLLQCVQQEEVKTIWKKLSDTIAELAGGIMEEGQWDELLPFMFQCVSSQSDRLKECALFIFCQLSEYLGHTLDPYLGTLHNVFAECLAATSSSNVRLAALKATARFLEMMEPRQMDQFQDLLPGMMQTLNLALQTNDEATAQEALKLLIELAGTVPRFLRRQLQDVVAAMLQVAEAQELEEGTRHLAVELLVTLAEAREKAPGMMRKLPQFIGRLFNLLMLMLLDIEDDPAWHIADRDSDLEEVDSANYDVAQSCLDRLAISLKGNTILPVASQLLPTYLADSDWKKRHAALVTLAQIAEGCAKVMVKSLDPIVTMVLGSFQDPHPRVRWAAINAMGQLATDLQEDLQNECHARILPAIISCMDDFENPRVQAHAASATLNFTEGCTAEIVAPYLGLIVSKLLTLLQTGKRMVQEGALTAMASVADCAQLEFEKYYDGVMPNLIHILVHANGKEDRILRAKSMECISLVGMAVGKDKFRADAKKVMDVLMSLQGLEMESDDPTISYMLQAWARLCKCLGQEFLPYMDVVMPPLMRSAQLKPDVTITEAVDSDDEGDDVGDDSSVETIRIGDKRIGIRTSVLEEKATACNMLCCYAEELKEGFYPWIDPVASTLVPLLKFYFHEDVRKAAVSAMPELLRASKLAVEKGTNPPEGPAVFMKRMTDNIVPPLVDALKKEPEVEISASMVNALTSCIRISGSVMDEGQIKTIVDQLKVVIVDIDERRRERAERAVTEDFDADDKETLEEENLQEDEMIDEVGECIGTLMKVFKAAFLPFFDELLPLVLQLLAKERTLEEQRVGVCIFDDVAEHGGEPALKYYDAFLPFVMEAANSTDQQLRQASVYGIGVCAQFGGQKFKPLVPEALARLNSVVYHPEARNEPNIAPTENAISAVGKICQFQRDCIDAEQVVPAWLSCLPLHEDLVEAQVVHEQLCSMVERSDPHLLGPANKNLPKIISVFAEVLAAGSDLATPETTTRMVAVLRQLEHVLPRDQLLVTWSAIPPAQQAALQLILAGQQTVS